MGLSSLVLVTLDNQLNMVDIQFSDSVTRGSIGLYLTSSSFVIHIIELDIHTHTTYNIHKTPMNVE